MRLTRPLTFVLAVGLLASGAGAATMALATPSSGATTTILASRARLSSPVRVNDDGVRLQTKQATDVMVQTITFQPKGHSGWHHHPGVVVVVVQSGQLTTHDEECRTRTYGPNETFVESGRMPFRVSNESATENTVVYATLVVPAGSPFRVETDAPPCA